MTTVFILAALLLGTILVAKYQISQDEPKCKRDKGLIIGDLSAIKRQAMEYERQRIVGEISQKKYDKEMARLDKEVKKLEEELGL